MFKFLVVGGWKYMFLFWGEVVWIGCLIYDIDGLEGSCVFEGLLEVLVGGSVVCGFYGGIIIECCMEW